MSIIKNLKETSDGRFSAPVIKPITDEEYTLVFKDTGEERKIYMEFHPRDDEFAADTAKRFREEYLIPFARYLTSDDHKYDLNTSIPDNIYGFCYTLVKDALTDKVLGFYSNTVIPKKYKGRDAVLLEGHAMFASPGIFDYNNTKLKKIVEEHGSDGNASTISVPCRKNDEIMINATPGGMGARKGKDKETGSGLGTLVTLYQWGHAVEYYDDPMLYSLETANEASGYIISHKFGPVPFEGENWHETGSFRRNKKGQRCLIKYEKFFHKENW